MGIEENLTALITVQFHRQLDRKSKCLDIIKKKKYSGLYDGLQFKNVLMREV